MRKGGERSMSVKNDDGLYTYPIHHIPLLLSQIRLKDSICSA
jgi:hypothetical protein